MTIPASRSARALREIVANVTATGAGIDGPDRLATFARAHELDPQDFATLAAVASGEIQEGEEATR